MKNEAQAAATADIRGTMKVTEELRKWVSVLFLSPRAVVRFVGAFAFVCVVGIYGLRCTPDPPIRSDGGGYYAYLPALVIDHDLSMRGILARGADISHGINPYAETGGYLDKYPVGEALMMAPFFFAAHEASLLLGRPADGYGFFYQAFAALAGLVYGWLGVAILRQVLEQRFDARVTAWTLLGVVFGTNLFHYFTWESLYSHAYSFFLIALLVQTVPRWHARPTLARTLSLGAIAGLIVLVRPTNACTLLYVPLYQPGGIGPWLRRLPWMSLVAGVAAALFAIQLGYWHHATGHWLAFSYQGERFNPLSPKPLHVLVSFKKGLFVWAPILVASVVGLWEARRDAMRRDFAAVVAVLLAQLSIVSSWWCWWYGTSLGHRAFTEFVPFFALGLGAFLQRRFDASPWVAQRCRRLYGWLTGYGVLMMVLYWTGVLPFDGLNWGPLL